MKKVKLKLNLENLTLGKETVINLSETQMSGVIGGVTQATDSTCHSYPAGTIDCPTGGGPTIPQVADGCASYATNCYSACQTGCDSSGSSWCSDTGYTFCYC